MKMPLTRRKCALLVVGAGLHREAPLLSSQVKIYIGRNIFNLNIMIS